MTFNASGLLQFIMPQCRGRPAAVKTTRENSCQPRKMTIDPAM